MSEPSKYILCLIEAARERKGVKSNYALANKIGVPQSTMAVWTRGVSLPSGEGAFALAAAAGVNGHALILWGLVQREQGRRARGYLRKLLPDDALMPKMKSRKVCSPW